MNNNIILNGKLNNNIITQSIEITEVRGGEGNNLLCITDNDLNKQKLLLEKIKQCKKMNHKPVIIERSFDTQYGERPFYFAICDYCNLSTYGCFNEESAFMEWNNNCVKFIK